ncbi:hypothetical protein A8H37_28390 [Burkholderia thailandensis]|nr:hypothetical protein A8H37_28390 [Burkholderia thailandensis]
MRVSASPLRRFAASPLRRFAASPLRRGSLVIRCSGARRVRRFPSCASTAPSPTNRFRASASRASRR